MTGWNRRSVIGGLGAGIATAACASPGGQAYSGRSNGGKPNIIFIMADDLGYGDLGITGSRHIKTPNIDKIAANGLLLTQGYSNSSICSPTRTGLLSGCYQYRFRVGLEEPITPQADKDLGLPFDRRTIASVMKEQGYETALVGKWHLGNPPEHGPLEYGYNHFFGIAPGGADYFRHRPIVGGREVGTGLLQGNEEIERAGYLTDVFGDEAVRLIDESRGAPLFLSLHFTAPHWPWEGREDEEVSRQLKEFFHFDGGTLETYANMVTAMDDNVGRVVEALKRNGMYDNTIIVFTSDNGGERFSDTWPFVGIKGELLEGGIRVPILMQWPGHIQPGRVSDQVMISMDFLPTFLTVAGGNVPEGEFDGMDLSAQLVGSAPVVERTLYWRHKTHDQRAIRSGDWKYLKIGKKEHLFNLALDPRERAELKDKYPERLASLKAQYADWNAGMLAYPEESISQDSAEKATDRY